MQRSKIEWCDYVLNPIVGCPHGCSYCYAKQLNKRFKFVPVWEEPQFFPERLKRSKAIKLPKNRNRIAQLISPDKPVVFVGSMADVFAKNVERTWVLKILEFAENHQEAIFVFLTKRPMAYSDYIFTSNCIIGTSISSDADYTRVTQLHTTPFVHKFVSIEPLLGRVTGQLHGVFTHLKFVIVGAQTGANATKPKLEWVESIKHPTVYYKDNILKYFPNLS
jgi:protein gp37